MSMKAVVGVIVVAIFIGVLYVVLEKSFFGGGALSSSNSSSAQEISKSGKSAGTTVTEETIITLPEIQMKGAPIDSSSNMLSEAESLEMRDYSGLFEEFKDSLNK